MFIIVYRLNGALQCDTHYIGTFDSHDDAYDFLCTLPAVTLNQPEGNGVKFIQELTPHGVRYGFGEKAGA